MTTVKRKLYSATLIFYTVLSIASTLYLIFRPEDHEIQQKFFDTQQQIERIQHFLEEQDSVYEETIFSLQQENDSLYQVIEANDLQLFYVREQAKESADAIYHYVDRFEIDTSLTKNEITFDSLAHLSRSYLALSETRDSLCEDQLMTLEELMEVKNNIIISEQQLIDDYKSSVDELKITCEALESEKQQAIELLERKNRRCRVLSGAIIASLTTTILILAN
jgi:hypothetical protein